MNEIRVRFAPSPTGKLHVGTSKIALFNYLFARKNKGKIILRFEDTDQERSTKESEQNILESLKWLGLSYDEGPYRQMERLPIYKKYAELLLKEGKAYYCYCTKEELDKEREEARRKKRPYRYSRRCCGLTENKKAEFIKQGRKPVIRFKLPNEKIRFTDLIKGNVEFDMNDFGDPIIMRADGMPIYNLANVVDDHEMGITHVIRGEDLLSSTSIQMVLGQSLGFEVLSYAHMSLTLAKDKTKLSKRHGAVAITDYREMGYLPEAVINFIVLLGWHPGEGDTQEFFTLTELEKEFSLERVGKSAAIFDIERLNYINGYYIRKMSVESLARILKPFLPNTNPEGLKKLATIAQTRIEKLTDIKELTDFYFTENKYKPEILIFKKSSKGKTLEGLKSVLVLLEKLKNWDKIEDIKKVLEDTVGCKVDLNFGDVFWPVRVALSGKEKSPSPEELLWVLSREESIKRIKKAISLL